MSTLKAVSVRRAGPDDVETIARFNVAMALETENKHIATDLLTAGVDRMVSDETLGFYLVALKDEQVAGCLGVTFEWSDWRNGLFWWIQSVYVSEESRGKGVFTAMYDHVKQAATRTPEVIGLRLYADAHNNRAIRTYHHLGMTTTDYQLLEIELTTDSSGSVMEES